ncbi:hypothetical protein OEZ85_011070 [Tetradesmus obliquus]|uniref:Uncharacterized protein n=1 Tax=Tetradesmus obliquus TaxID=3088 RepID=A0ABY8TPD6_TETOB|nr:hypothetical protein OEZ85_011070 [Tetradesmus obliquus]
MDVGHTNTNTNTMAQDVARRIFEMACSQRASEAEQRRAASKRLIRFELHASVELPADEAEVEELEETVRVQIEARAPGIVLHSQPAAQPGSSHHWHLEYEGMQYDITEFPQGVSFVLRCVVDTLLSRFSEQLIDKGVFEAMDARLEAELCAFTCFGSSLLPTTDRQAPSGVRPWTHTFGRLFFFPNTLEASYEAAMQRPPVRATWQL